MSAKDYLLRWAKKTTHKYPGVRIQDFTKSWRDGLAFSAIIHRNRPDLIDWRRARTQHARERMENAFYLAEREYGVTRLLDPEGKWPSHLDLCVGVEMNIYHDVPNDRVIVADNYLP